jgi:hypothetical protein
VFRNVHVHANVRPLPRGTVLSADLRREKALRNANLI